MKIFKVLVASFVLAISSVGSVPVAQAAPGDSISLYFSAPFVTGSSVTDGATTENFNSFSTGACPTNIPGFAALSFTPGNCAIESQPGSSPGDSEPAIGVPTSGFLSNVNGTTFTFDSPVKYVGFWWMMGGGGNSVDFLDSNNSNIASFDVADVITFLGPNSSVSNSDTRTVTNVGGGTYLTRHFYRSPSAYTGTLANPVIDYSVSPWANEPWVYLNLFVSGDITVSKVRFEGAAFELDNLTVATRETGPTPSMVLVKNILGTAPSAQLITWDPTNTSYSGTDPELIPDTQAASTGSGAITYEVVDAGTAGCTVEASTGAITYTSAGDCVVRAVAAAVPGQYFSAYKDVTFTFATEPDGGTDPTDPTDPSSPTLADTGFDPLVPLGVAFAALLAGFGAMRIARRNV
jgi:hypothetical protein